MDRLSFFEQAKLRQENARLREILKRIASKQQADENDSEAFMELNEVIYNAKKALEETK